MKLVLAAALLACSLHAQSVIAESAGPISELTINVTALGLTTSNQNGLVVECYSGTGFTAGNPAGSKVTGDLTPITQRVPFLTGRTLTSVTAEFSRARENVACTAQMAVGAGSGNVTGPAAGTGGELPTVSAAGTVLSRSALTGVLKAASGVPSVVSGTSAHFVRVDGTSAAGGAGDMLTNATNTLSSAGIIDAVAGKIRFPEKTVATLPAAASNTGMVYHVTDSATAGDCTVGGGTADALCSSDGSVWYPFGDGGSSTDTTKQFKGYTTVSFSATPTFTASSTFMFFITLTGNVTSSTFASPITGQIYAFNICQDGTGSRTFAWPTGFTGAGVIDSTASACSRQVFTWDGSAAVPVSSMTSNGPPGAYLSGSTSGFTHVKAEAVASGIVTVPSVTDQLVGRATTDTLTNKTLTTPTISSTGFTNAQHAHVAANSGGTLDAAAIAAGTMATARLGSGTANSGTFLRGDQTWAAAGGTSTWEYPFTFSVDGAGVLSARLPMVSVSTNTGSAAIGSGAAGLATLSLPLAGTGMIGIHMHLDSRFVTNGAVSVKFFALTGAAETITWSIAFGCMADGYANSTAIATNAASTPAIAQNNNTWTQVTVTGIVATGCEKWERAVLTIAHAASTNDVYLAGGLAYQ